jgi:D-serine dehydratase
MDHINQEFKGFPSTAGVLTLDDIGLQGWNLLEGDLPMPVATLKSSVLESNSRWMRIFTEKYGARIAPHGKTTMSPQLFQRQMDDGAWAITVANVHQLRLCRKWNVERVLVANQISGLQNLRELTSELAADPEFDCYLLVDSAENVNQLADAAMEQNLFKPIQVLVELGFTGGRTGCRTVEAAVKVAHTVKSQSPLLSLRGVEGYEALLRSQPDPEIRICKFLEDIKELVNLCICEDLFAKGPVIITAGGSDFFDLVLGKLTSYSSTREIIKVIRSGCYLTHDSLNYQRIFERIQVRTPKANDLAPGLLPALQVWGAIQSIPEAGLAIVNVGKRDISYDMELPIPELSFRPGIDITPQTLHEDFEVYELNDQHAYVKIPEQNKYRVGDLFAFGISHPCTTFDKWRLLYLVDDNYRVTGGIRTFLA